MSKKKFVPVFLAVFVFLFPMLVNAQNQEPLRYIDVVGTAEMDIVPDEIHFIISIKEYFKEEFKGKSKPEDYKTKVPISQIEKGVRDALKAAGVKPDQIRTEEIGDYWRERGKDFLIGKNFDITLDDFTVIDKIISSLDTKGISSMRIGELKNNDMARYHEEGKIAAIKAAKRKAEYLLDAVGETLGEVIHVQEPREGTDNYMVKRASNVMMMDEMGAAPSVSPEQFRTISVKYSINVRFAIADRK